VRFGKLEGCPVVCKLYSRNGDHHFYHELIALLYTRHDANIVKLVSVDIKKRRLFLEAMDMDLRHFFTTSAYQQIGFAELATLGHDMARGLHYLHQRKLLHCDLKSENVLLCRQTVTHDESTRGHGPKSAQRWVAKLCDFDLVEPFAFNESWRQNLRLPIADSLKNGNLIHKAPEIMPYKAWRYEMRYATPQSDVMALAILLWELFMGKEYEPPDSFSTRKTFMEHVIMRDGRPKLRDFLTHVSSRDSVAPVFVRNVAYWLVQMWSKYPKRRLSTARLLKAFEALRNKLNQFPL
jgi:serine/threonine protein kinase